MEFGDQQAYADIYTDGILFVHLAKIKPGSGGAFGIRQDNIVRIYDPCRRQPWKYLLFSWHRYVTWLYIDDSILI